MKTKYCYENHKTCNASTCNVLARKVLRVKAGEPVVFGTDELEIIEAIEDPLFKRFATLPNPNRVGTKDTYIGFLKGV